jgi:hypothetical protein
MPKLTRSQQLFSRVTMINPLSLSISKGNEFFLFMDMRAEQQWTSYGTSPRQWAKVTNEYNTRLEALAESSKLPFIPKNPRALMDKLGEIEPKISDRLLRQDFQCQSPLIFSGCQLRLLFPVQQSQSPWFFGPSIAMPCR